MRVPDEVRKCTVYLGIRVQRMGGYHEDIWYGTGFLVGITSEMFPDRAYNYIVTARHVVEQMQQGESVIRINMKDGSAITAGLPNADWCFHPDGNTVDVAVLQVPIPEQADQKFTPSTMFVTDKMVTDGTVAVGDDVFMTGLFAYFTGKARNVPIVRMGNVAMIPDSTVPSLLGEIEAYLVEARSIGGLSGSPVFVANVFGAPPLESEVPFYLLGLMHGHWKVPVGNVNVPPSPDMASNDEAINMGIAMVVPAKKILEVLNMPGLRADRAEKDKVRRDLNLPVMDSAMNADDATGDTFTKEDFEDALKKVSRRVKPSPPDQETP